MVEAEKISIQYLTDNCKINCDNVVIVNNAIFNEDDKDVLFGKNKFIPNSKLNDSTSQIYEKIDDTQPLPMQLLRQSMW